MIRGFLLLAVLNGVLVSQLPLWQVAEPAPKPARGGKRVKPWALAKAEAPRVIMEYRGGE